MKFMQLDQKLPQLQMSSNGMNYIMEPSQLQLKSFKTCLVWHLLLTYFEERKMYILSIRAWRIFILKEKPKCAKILGAEFFRRAV